MAKARYWKPGGPVIVGINIVGIGTISYVFVILTFIYDFSVLDGCRGFGDTADTALNIRLVSHMNTAVMWVMLPSPCLPEMIDDCTCFIGQNSSNIG